MILKPTIIIISCFLFMSTVSPRLALCFRVPQLLLKGGVEGTGQEQSTWSYLWSLTHQGRHGGPVDLGVTGAQYVPKKWGQGGHDSGQVGMKSSACPEV